MADGVTFEIKIENNTSVVKKATQEAKDRALYAIGLKAVEGAVMSISGRGGVDSAVDTGRLRASISFVTSAGETGDAMNVGSFGSKESQVGDTLSGNQEKDCVYVGTNVEYAPYVHNGTTKMPARPFLIDGIERTKDEMKEQVELILKGEL